MDPFGNKTNSSNNSEPLFYEQLFRSFDSQNFGTVQGGQVFGFFLSSGLNKGALGDIWDEATQKQSGGLTVAKFINAMKLISLAQRGIAPKFPNIAQNAPIPLPQMQYPSHIKKPVVQSQKAHQQIPQLQQPEQPQPQQQLQKPAEPDPFGALTSSLGFDIGSAPNEIDVLDNTKPNAPTWTTIAADDDNTNTNTLTNDLMVNDGGMGMGASDDLAGDASFDSPKMSNGGGNDMNANTPNGMNNISSMPSMSNINMAINPINEYGPVSHMQQHSHIGPTLTIDPPPNPLLSVNHSDDNNVNVNVNVGAVAPLGLNRRVSTKILYTQERLREQIRQAEQREELAKKQANTQRIENERLERENEQLKFQINAARQAQADALKQSQEALTSIQPLRVENSKLKEAISQWKQLIQRKDEELEALEHEVDHLRLENEKFENVLRDDKSRIDDIQFKLERSDALLSEFKIKSNHSLTQIKLLKQEKIALEDDKRNLDLRVAQIKDEMKKLKRNQHSGLGLDKNTLKQKEADLFDINDIQLKAPQAQPQEMQIQTQTQTLTLPPRSQAQAAQSDDDDTGIVPPGSHDFNFSEIATTNATNAIYELNELNEPGHGHKFTDDEDEEEEEEEEEDSYIDEEVFEEVTVDVLFEEEYNYKSSVWYMSASDVKNYHKYFIQADSNKDGMVDGNEANKFFTKSKLNRKVLAKIWVLSDQKKQGKLTEPMFCSMFHLVMKIKKSGNKLSAPNQLPQCLTEAVVQKLGTKIQKTIKEKKIIKVENAKKKKAKRSKKKKKKNTPPPLPPQQEQEQEQEAQQRQLTTVINSNFATLDNGFGDDWGNNFSFDTQETTKKTMPTQEKDEEIVPPSQGAQETQQKEHFEDDDNWNAFGNFFDK